MLFSIINILIVRKNKSKKTEFLYIIPFVVLVSIFCYSNSLMEIEIFKEMVDGKITSVLTFLSFGLIFVSEFINHNNEMYVQKKYEISAINQMGENSSIILMLTTKYMTKKVKKGIPIDKESEAFLEEIIELSSEQMKMATIDVDLLSLDKENFTIEDVNNVYKKHSDLLNYDKVSKDFTKSLKKDKKIGTND